MSVTYLEPDEGVQQKEEGWPVGHNEVQELPHGQPNCTQKIKYYGLSTGQLLLSYPDPVFMASPAGAGIQTGDLLVEGRGFYHLAMSPPLQLHTRKSSINNKRGNSTSHSSSCYSFIFFYFFFFHFFNKSKVKFIGFCI